LADAAKQGYQGVLSNGYYIDLAFPASQHYVVDPLPTDTVLTAEEQRRVLGGEATMWSEWVSPETVDSRVWPRTAAIAERLWSPREVTDVDDMYRRLAIIEYQLEELGLAHRKNQQMLLRRLAMGADTSALEALVSVIEPVKEYRRYQVRPQTMLSPLTGLIDAARPDAKDARAFNVAVEGLLAGSNRAGHTAKIRSLLANWRSKEGDLKRLVDSSPALAEARQLSDDFRTLNQMIQEAADALESASKQTSEWRNTNLKALDEVAKPKAGVEFAILLGVRKLVDAASGT
jgi:hexosaminidase